MAHGHGLLLRTFLKPWSPGRTRLLSPRCMVPCHLHPTIQVTGAYGDDDVCLLGDRAEGRRKERIEVDHVIFGCPLIQDKIYLARLDKSDEFNTSVLFL